MLFAVSFFFSSRRRHTRWNCDWSSDVCSSDVSRQRNETRCVQRRAEEQPYAVGAGSRRLGPVLEIRRERQRHLSVVDAVPRPQHVLGHFQWWPKKQPATPRELRQSFRSALEHLGNTGW